MQTFQLISFQNMINREGRPINEPKFNTGAVFVTPIDQFKNGTKINAPPPPDIVDITKATIPAINNRIATSGSVSLSMERIKSIKY